MRLIGDIDYRLRILALPSPVPSPQDCKEHYRQSQHEQEDNNHKTPNPPLFFRQALLQAQAAQFTLSVSLDAIAPR